MNDKGMLKFIDDLSSALPAPGGGGASAMVGAFAAAMGLMVSNLTIGKKKYESVQEDVQARKDELVVLQKKLIDLIEEDAKAFLPLAEAYKLPAENEEEQRYKQQVMEKTLYDASIVPMEIMKNVLQTMEILSELKDMISRLIISDVGVGISLGHAAIESAILNVYINAGMMKDRTTAENLYQQAEEILRKSNQYKNSVYCNIVRELK